MSQRQSKTVIRWLTVIAAGILIPASSQWLAATFAGEAKSKVTISNESLNRLQEVTSREADSELIAEVIRQVLSTHSDDQTSDDQTSDDQTSDDQTSDGDPAGGT